MTRWLVLDALGSCAAAGFVMNGACALVAWGREGGRADGLASAVARVLADAERIEAIAVATGPGGFTGARAGVALARGLALARGAPAVGVSLFQALADLGDGDIVLPGAGGRAWSQGFAGGAPLGPPSPAAVGAAIDPRAGLFPSPEGLGRIAAAAARLARSGRPAPLYLRPPDAAPPAEGPVALLP